MNMEMETPVAYWREIPQETNFLPPICKSFLQHIPPTEFGTSWGFFSSPGMCSTSPSSPKIEDDVEDIYQ